MGLRDRLQDRAVRAAREAQDRAANSVPTRMAGDGLRGFRGMIEGEDEGPGVESFLLSLVRAVRSDELVDDRSRRQVYVAARKRRRRLGILALGLGPLAAVANQVADLYCETAVVCDLADFHGKDLADAQVVAHLLVLWRIADDFDSARRSIAGNPPVANLLGRRLLEHLDQRLPDQPSRRSIVTALWDVRADLGAARKGVTGEAFRAAAFTGHRTKNVIGRVEVQLGVGQP